MCNHQQWFRLDVQYSALVHNFIIIFSKGHLYRARQSMNSLPSQILERYLQYQMNTLTKPGSFLLVLFGLLTVPAMLYAFYRFSLPWFNFFAYSVSIFVATPLIIFLVVTVFIDSKFSTKLKRYSILAAVLFICCLLIFPKVKTFIIKDTEIKGQKLVDAIESYKEINGFWPKSLNDPYFNSYSKTAIVQRPFYYRLDKSVEGDTTVIFYFYSFDGLEARLRINSTKFKSEKIIWNYSD